MAIARIYLIVLFISTPCSLLAADTAPSDDKSSEQIFDALDPHVNAMMKRYRTPGVAMALTNRDGLVGVRNWGYADLKAHKPVTDQTLFQIGSISKSFTALALLQAQEAGAIDVNEPVSRYLPWFTVRSRFEPIRARHLLTHTAGIPANRDDIFSSPYMAVALGQRDTAWAPGTRFYYSNIGYQVLTALLLSATDKTYEEIIEERFFEPLGMTESEPAIRLESRSRQAIGYVPPFDDRPVHHSRNLVEAPFHEYRIGDGSIQSTAGDLASYVRMWLNRGAGPKGAIVSEQSFAHFASIQPGTTSDLADGGEAKEGYGFGVSVFEKDGRAYLTHSGGMVGHSAYVVANMTDGYGVTVLINGPGAPGELGYLALGTWHALDTGEALPAPPELPDLTQVDNAADYAGIMRSQSGSSIEFRASRDTLSIMRGDTEILLERRGTDTFYTPAADFDRYFFVFGRNDDGVVVEVTHGAEWYKTDGYAGDTTFEIPDEWHTYVGRYRNFSPWFPYCEVVISKGELVVITGEGGETSTGATRLAPMGTKKFRVGDDPTPEVLEFMDIVDGRAMRLAWSGHPFFRQ